MNPPTTEGSNLELCQNKASISLMCRGNSTVFCDLVQDVVNNEFGFVRLLQFFLLLLLNFSLGNW